MTEDFNWKRWLESKEYKDRCISRLREELLPELKSIAEKINLNDKQFNVVVRASFVKQLYSHMEILLESLGGSIQQKVERELEVEIVELEELE